MKKKNVILSVVLSLACVCALRTVPTDITASAETPVTITDTCDSTSSGAFFDIYRMAVGTTNYGWGTDGKYRMAGFEPTAPVTLSTWSSGGYPYVRYNLSGQNTIKVLAYENPKTRDKFDEVFCFVKKTDNTNVQLKAVDEEVSATSSVGWCQVTYTYEIENPETAKWVQLTHSTFTDATIGVVRDDQHISNVEIFDKNNVTTPTIPQTIEDSCDELPNAVVNGYYRLTLSTTNLGFGTDGKYRIQTINPTAPPTAETYEEYAYVRYTLSGQNYLQVMAMEPPTRVGELDPVFCRVRYADRTGVVLQANNTVIEASSNWCKVTYTFIIPNAENASWVDCIPTAYVDDANGYTKADQQITHVKITYEDATLLTAKQELRNYATAKGKNNYQETSWNDVLSITSKALIALETADNLSTVVTQAKADIDAVKTLAQELADLKQEQKLAISDYAVNKGIENYTTDSWTLIIGYVTQAQTAIDTATDRDGIQTAVDMAKQQINAVNTISQNQQNNSTTSVGAWVDGGTEQGDSGCGSNMLLGSGVLTTLAFVGILRKKKRDNNEN